MHKDKRSDSDFHPKAPEIKQAGGKDAVLNAMALAVSVSGDRPVGFVLDADLVPGARWQAVCDRLEGLGLQLPAEAPREGFVANSEIYRTRVGVWLMPDNQRDGALETFLEDLVEDADQLLSTAEQSTAHARDIGALFPKAKCRKAVLHTWLPAGRAGLPYTGGDQERKFSRRNPAPELVSWVHEFP